MCSSHLVPFCYDPGLNLHRMKNWRCSFNFYSNQTCVSCTELAWDPGILGPWVSLANCNECAVWERGTVTEGNWRLFSVPACRLVSQVKGRAVKIRPKTKDWLKGLREELIRKRDSMAPVSPTANSCLLEENFDFTSLDYESEGE